MLKDKVLYYKLKLTIKTFKDTHIVAVITNFTINEISANVNASLQLRNIKLEIS